MRSTADDRTVLLLCIGAFCVAMGLRGVVNIWIGTGVAAVVSAALLTRAPSRARFFALGAPWRGAVVGVGVGVAMSVATWGLYPVATDLVPAIEIEVQRLYALLRQAPGPLHAFPILVLVVFVEEVVWRGLAIEVFSRKRGPVAAVLIAGVTYVLPQVALGSPLLVAVAFVCGLVWGALRIRCGGLLAPLLAHWIWDLLVFVLFPVG